MNDRRGVIAVNEVRKKICGACQGKTYCRQPRYPITHEELEYIGATWDDVPNAESVRKMMEISMKPECMEWHLQEHPIEWWVEKITI